MATLEVRINGEQADIGGPSDFKVIIDRQIFDFQDAASQGGDFVIEAQFPATKTNHRIFGPNLSDVNASRKFRSVRPLRIEIFADGTRIFKGVPVVERASKEGGYDCALYSDNIDWANILQNKSLRDLATIPDVPFTGSRFYGAPHEPASPLRQVDIEPLTASEIAIQFPLVAYGNYGDLNGLSVGLAANKVQDVKWVDIPPCAYVVPIFRAIFRELGFNLAGGFFDTPEAQKFITAYTGDTPPRWNWGLLARANASHAASYVYEAIVSPPSANFDFQVQQGLIWRLVTSAENWDYSDSYFQSSPSEQYITPVTGSYRFTIETGSITLFKGLEGTLPNPTPYDYLRTAIAIVVVPDDNDDFDALQASIVEYIGDQTVSIVSDPNIIAFYDFGTGYEESPYTLQPFSTGGTYSQAVTGVPGNPGASLDGTGTITLQIEGVELSMGTRVEFWLISQYAVLNPVDNQTFDIPAYEVDIKETSYPDLLQVAPLLPDMTQFEYVKSLITAFNLRFSVDLQKMVMRFETHDLFFRNNQFARDFTSKGSDIDTPSRPVPFYRNSKLSWANDDSDALLSQFGTSQFEHSEENSSAFAINDLEEIVVSGFSPTYEREYAFRNLFGSVPTNRVIIPCMATDTQLSTPQGEVVWEYNYKPRLLKYIGLQPGSWTYEGATRTSYPAARFSFDETGGGSLAFGEGAAKVVRGAGAIAWPVSNEGLWERYWRRFFTMRVNSHIQEIIVTLNAQDFADADVSLPILFHGIHYWLYAFVDGFDPVNEGEVRIDLLRQV